METPAAHLGSTVTVISGEELEKRQVDFVADALREVPGVDVVRTGGFGATTAVFIRGANANHTLALVDGIELADPSIINGAVDFADFAPDNIERIEVLRGPASSLYGSDAIGGVVNIITREGSGTPGFTFTGEGGTYQTYRALASAHGGIGLGTYSLSASRLSSQGLSTDPLQPLPYERTNLTAKLGASLAPEWKLSLATRYLNSRANLLPTLGGRAAFDPNDTSRTDQVLMRPELRGSLLQGSWRPTIGFSWARTSRALDDLPDPGNPSTSRSRFLGIRTKLDFQNEFKPAPGNRAVVLFERKEETAETSSESASPAFSFSSSFPHQSAETYAAMIEDRQRLFDRFYLTASGRWDHHSLFGNALTQSAALSYELAETGTRLHAAEGSGFKAPSLLQLEDPQYGNRELKPERSQSFEIGFEQPVIGEALRAGGTFFTTEINQLIGFDPNTFRSININKAQINGVEIFARTSIGPIRAGGEYSWMHPMDLSPCPSESALPCGGDLLRRPRHKVDGRIEYVREELSVTARVGYVGSRQDTDFTSFPSARISLGSYILFGATANYRLTRQLALMGRVENVFDQQYQEVYTYPVPGRSFFLGVRAEL
jgi:vitamin B12 transporter